MKTYLKHQKLIPKMESIKKQYGPPCICIGKDLDRPEPHMRNHTSGKDFRFDKTKFMERYVFGGLKNVGLQCLIFH